MSTETKTPKTHGEAYAANHNGLRDKLAAAAQQAAEARQSDWYREYLAASLPKEHS
jgi:hypothetical protein